MTSFFAASLSPTRLKKANGFKHPKDPDDNVVTDLFHTKALFEIDFLEEFNKYPVSKGWFKNLNLAAVIAIIRRHWMVQKLASHFLSQTISTYPISQDTTSNPPSWTETYRVCRGLNLFELYRPLLVHYTPDRPLEFGEVELHPGEEARNYHFLRGLTPYLSEEVVCIYEYLINNYYRIVQECGPDLARLENSVSDEGSNPTKLKGLGSIFCNSMSYLIGSIKSNTWLGTSTTWWLEEGDGRIEYLISLGLGFFSRLVHSTPETQSQILFENRYAR